MTDERSMLVTGATGVVGSEIVEQARAAGWKVAACSARGAPDAVAWRMAVEPTPGDLRGPWGVVVHAAARPRWNLTVDDAVRGNVAPVAALESVVGPATHVIHMSTAFAVGLRGSTESCDLADYRNTYEWSKAAAERSATARYGATIVRPPLVIGRRSDGAVSKFSGLYSLLHAAVTGLLPALVGEPDAPVEIVSSCDIARCVLQLAATGPAQTPVVLGGGAAALPVKSLSELLYLALNSWRVVRGCEALNMPSVITPNSGGASSFPLRGPT